MSHSAEREISCEWAEQGLAALLPISEVVVIVDVLSFSTCVDIAVERGAVVFPYPWKDDSARAFATDNRAELAHPRGKGGLSLSPSSFLDVAAGTRVVLPSPNGAALSLRTADKATIAGCLRNAAAVATAASTRGGRVAVIPAGERWSDGSLRPALEDWLCAGAIIDRMSGRRSPEAQAAADLYRICGKDIKLRIQGCMSGRELIGRGFEQDVELASQIDVSPTVPLLREGAYSRQAR